MLVNNYRKVRTIFTYEERAARRRTARFLLVLFFTCFLAAAFACQRFFYALSLAGLQVKRVTLYFLNNVLGLYLPLKSPQRIFEGFSLLKSNFRQRTTPPLSSCVDLLVMASIAILSQVDYERIFMLFRNSTASKIASAAERTRSSASSSLQVADNKPDRGILPTPGIACT